MLDGVCVSHLANDETDRTFPSLNTGSYKPAQEVGIWLMQVYLSTRPEKTSTPPATSNGEDCLLLLGR